jgi:cytosine/adenosine deaminase-related metal-dependent hydrolase
MSARDYTAVYEKCGLLTPKTMLGHCIHLSAREIEAIAAARWNAAHRPTSNLETYVRGKCVYRRASEPAAII